MKIPKFLKSNTLIAVLVLLNLAVGGVILFRHVAQKRHLQTKSEWYAEQNAEWEAKTGIMSREQSHRVDEIGGRIEANGGRISDSDLKYCLSIFGKPVERKSFLQRQREDMIVGMLIEHVLTAPSPAQCDALYSEFCRDTANPAEFNEHAGSFVTVAAILARAHDQRITNTLLTMRNDRNPSMRQDVATLLRELGHYKQADGKS